MNLKTYYNSKEVTVNIWFELILPPVLNPKCYDEAQVLEASGCPMLVRGRRLEGTTRGWRNVRRINTNVITTETRNTLFLEICQKPKHHIHFLHSLSCYRLTTRKVEGAGTEYIRKVNHVLRTIVIALISQYPRRQPSLYYYASKPSTLRSYSSSAGI